MIPAEALANMRVSCGVDMPVRGGRTFVRVTLLYAGARGGPWVVSANEAVEAVEGDDVHGAFERARVAIAEQFRVAVPPEADPSLPQEDTPIAEVRRRRAEAWN